MRPPERALSGFRGDTNTTRRLLTLPPRSTPRSLGAGESTVADLTSSTRDSNEFHSGTHPRQTIKQNFDDFMVEGLAPPMVELAIDE